MFLQFSVSRFCRQEVQDGVAASGEDLRGHCHVADDIVCAGMTWGRWERKVMGAEDKRQARTANYVFP